jgi:hypothetical protein
MRTDAMNVAQQRGATELGCPAATAEVQKGETVQEPQGTGWYEPAHRARYIVSVAGCDKRAAYSVACDSKGCVAGALAPETRPQSNLADALRPNAVKVAQEHGSSELGCPAATAEVRKQQTLEEPQTTGWYEAPHRAVYRVDVSGCGKRTTYLIACDNSSKKSCTAAVPKAESPTNTKSPVVDELQPLALKDSQLHGAAELGCSSVTAAILSSEAIQQPQGTGWYEPPNRAVYKVQVSGCGKRSTYLVACSSREKSCETGRLQNSP